MISVITSVIFLLGPAMVSCLIYARLGKHPFNALEFIMFFLMFCFVINAFSFGIMFLMGQGSRETASLFKNISSIAKYGVVSFAAAITIPNILLLLSKVKKG